MNRRNALLNIATLMGVSPFTGFAIEHFGKINETNFQASLFSSDEQKLIAEIAEIIVPTTATPGAKAAGVPAFIEMMLQDCYQKPQQDTFKKGLDSLGTNFLSLPSQEQNALLMNLEEQAMKNQSRVPTFWQLIKELTLLGYFTSEIGMTQAMEYVPVPSKFELIKLKKGQKTYSEYLAR